MEQVALPKAGVEAPPRIATDPSASTRKGQIDALRSFAIFWVVVDHTWMKAGTSAFGRLGVGLFLILSGYLITGIMLKSKTAIERGTSSTGPELMSFYMRRAIRILPPYLLVVGLTFALYRAEFEGTLLWHVLFQTSILFALQNEWGPPWQLTHFWTLSVQEQFYAVWPAMVFLLPRKYLARGIGIAMLAQPLFHLLLIAMGKQFTVAAMVLLPGSMAALGAGSLLAIWEKEGRVPWWLSNPIVPLLIAALLVAPVMEWVDWWGGLLKFPLELIMLIPLTALLYGASRGYKGPWGWFLNSSWMQGAGRISLGIYVYHLLIMSLLMDAAHKLGFGTFHRGPLLFAVDLAITLCVATLSWTFFEKPIGELKRYFPYGGNSRAKAP